MGRKKIYNTPEEKLMANRRKGMKFYWKHQEEVKKKNLERYHKGKNEIINTN